MAQVTIAPALTRWFPGQVSGTSLSESLPGETVRIVLQGLFEKYPVARGYIVDELGQIRHHVVIFVDGVAVSDKQHLSSSVTPSSEIYIFQALSGG